MITDKATGQFIGMLGELKHSVRKAFKLPSYTAAATLDLSGLQEATNKAANQYRPLSKYPAVQQDLCLRVPSSVSYQQVFESVNQSLHGRQTEAMVSTLDPLDIYQKESEFKQITLRYNVASYDKTMTDTEVAAMLDAAAVVAAEKLQATKI